MVKVSYGELDRKKGGTGQTLIRNAFLSMVAELVPEVWTELYEATKQTYRALKAEYPKEYFSKDIENFGLPPILADRKATIYDRYRSLAELITLVDGWTHKWNLVTSDPADPWVIKIALAHLEFWDTVGREGEYLALGFGGFGPIPAALHSPLGLRAYNPLLVTRQDYLSFVRADASKRIASDSLLIHIEESQKVASIDSMVEFARRYCHRVESLFQSVGLVRGREKRRLALHLEWAVRVHLKGDTQTALAKEAQLAGNGVTPQAVSKAVKVILEDVGLKANRRVPPSK